MKNFKRLTAACLLTSLASGAVWAAEGDIGPVYIKGVAVIMQNDIGHRAGNFELTISPAFTLPAGVSCDATYITTLAANDADKKLLMLSTAAQLSKSPVLIRISDSTTLSAFPGRCSIVAMTLSQ
jgi:hypothetical protein